jgi:DNA mismatch repair protein MutS2
VGGPDVNDATLADLEFDAIRSALQAGTATPMGALLATRLRPSTEVTEIALQQGLTLEAVRHLDERGSLPFGSLADPQPVLDRLAIEGSDCGPLEIQDLITLMKAGREVKSALALARERFARLWDAARDLPDLGNLVRFLDGKISPQGEVLDHASDDLAAIRRDLRRAGARLEEMLQQIVVRPEIARALQDDFVSIRSERHVIPIRSESRHTVTGIVHGVSGSGATVFVEPFETVEINNEIVTLRELEVAEVRRLLREYSALLRGRLPEIRALADGLGRIDLVLARARVGRSMEGVPAAISQDGGLRLTGARHPLVERSLRAQGTGIVPLDLALGPSDTVLVISGPNTGGKTVALKTVGLLALMHQSGLLVPARDASLPVFRSLFIDIGDRQSIQDRLSTFSARMRSIAGMAEHLDRPALLLLDEIGTGTDPEEGVALGIAIVDYFRGRGAQVIVTTHLETLKAWAASTPDCSNAAMQFDDATGAPSYRLVHGIPGRSSALEIAAHLGLPGSILERARALRGASGRLLDECLVRLERQSDELGRRLVEVGEQSERLARDRDGFEAAMREREERLRTAVAAEIEMAVGSVREEGERYLATLREREIALRMRREEEKMAARLRAEARRQIRLVAPQHEAASAPETLAPGARVRVRGIDIPGVVHEIQGGKVVVVVRGKRLVVPREDCGAVETAPGTAGARPRLPRGVTLERRTAEASGSVDVRGLPVDEALGRVDKFLDDASLEGFDQVRLVHGVGSGRLRQAIRELLAHHPQVAAFAAAPEKEGGEGATLVTLRS